MKLNLKVMKILRIIILLVGVCITVFVHTQEIYNSCDSALELCPNSTITVNNIGAGKTLCSGCEDDFSACFVPNNTIWLKFTTHELGGEVNINFSNINFEVEPTRGTSYSASIIQMGLPCIAASYVPIGNCISLASSNEIITSSSLDGNTTYYVVLSGDIVGTGVSLPSEFTVDVDISGSAVDRIIPNITLSLDKGTCINDLISVKAQRFNCPDAGSFRWFVNGVLQGVSASDSTFSIANLQHGDTIHVESDCFSLCRYIITDTLNSLTLTSIWADAGNDTTIIKGAMIQLHGSVSDSTIVVWSPSYSLSNPNLLSPISYPNETTTYTLTVIDTLSGCMATDYVTVFVDGDLIVPNTFSPNNDGDNDTWEIVGIENFPDCWVSIYNRWGQLVFQTTGYNKEKAWNGQSKVGNVNESVYFYEIQLRDTQKQVLNGSITIIR